MFSSPLLSIFLYTFGRFHQKNVEENRHPSVFLYTCFDFVIKSVEENGYSPVFLYTYAHFLKKAVEENSHPLIFLYSQRLPHQKANKTRSEGRRPPPHSFDEEKRKPAAQPVGSLVSPPPSNSQPAAQPACQPATAGPPPHSF